MPKSIVLICLILLTACSTPIKSLLKPEATSISMPGSKEKIPLIAWKNVPLQDYSSNIAPQTIDDTSVRFQNMAYRPKDKYLQAGDVIEVTVFDTGEDGLFSSANSKELKLGRATIDRTASLSLPFLKKISTKNLTKEALQVKITKELKGSTINPQVVVTVVSKASNSINVEGAVKNPGRYTLEPGKERVLDILTKAGLSDQNGQLTLIRNGEQASLALNQIISDSKQNILLQADDRLLFQGSETAKYTALGAFKSPGEIKFEPGKLTLTEAITRAGGVVDGENKVNDIYIFRLRSPDLNAAKPDKVLKNIGYHINISDVSNALSMQKFYLRDGDTLFASDKPITGW